MYSEKDLKIVESSIPIYVKEQVKTNKKKPKRGHFKHTGSLLCSEKELSPVRRYTTALVYDFDKMGPQFAFLFSRDDAFYQKSEDRLARTMSMTVNFDWAYLDKQQLDIHEVYVRGWWDVLNKKKFVHKTGKLALKDHMNFDDMIMDGNGEVMNPEYGIKMFIPPVTGVYRSWEDLEQIGTWSDDQTYENTYVHPFADKAIGIVPPSWKRYGGEPKPTKKKRTNREQRLIEEMTRQRAAQLAQLEQDALVGRRRRNRQAFEGGVGPRRGRIQTRDGEAMANRGRLDPIVQAAVEGGGINFNPGDWAEPEANPR